MKCDTDKASWVSFEAACGVDNRMIQNFYLCKPDIFGYLYVCMATLLAIKILVSVSNVIGWNQCIINYNKDVQLPITFKVYTLCIAAAVNHNSVWLGLFAST